MAVLFEQGHALIIGVGGDLPGTVKDAQGLGNLLIDPAYCSYPPEQVTALTAESASRQHILDGLAHLARSTTDQDTVLVYFSGHGYQQESGVDPSNYFLPYGYDPKELERTAIPGAQLRDALLNIPHKRLLLLFDCCHALALDSMKATEFTRSPLPIEEKGLFSEGQARMLISSSQANEFSYAGTPYSAFTLALMKALTGKGASQHSGYVRAVDLASFIGQEVSRITKGKQNPIVNFERADNFTIAYYAGGADIPVEFPFAEEPFIESQPGELDSPHISYQATQIGNGVIVMGKENRVVQERGILVEGDVQGDLIYVNHESAEWPEEMASYSLPIIPDTIHGRDLARVKSFILSSDNPFPYLTIHGPSGIGKTMMVVKAVDQLGDEAVKKCLYIELDETTRLLSELSRALSLKGSRSLQQVTDAIKNRELILVLDNAEHIKTVELTVFLNSLHVESKGKIIVISQKPFDDLPEPEKVSLMLPPLAPEAAKACFCDRWQPEEPLLPRHHADLDFICGPALLDGHPLAIRVAGNMARKSQGTELSILRGDLTRFKRKVEVHVQDNNPLSKESFGKNPWLALEVAFDHLNSSAKSLLCRLALLPGSFNLAVVNEIAQFSPTLFVTTTLDELLEYNLILKLEDGTYTIHNLVRIYAKYQFPSRPEAEELYGNIGNYLIDASQGQVTASWIDGMSYLLEGKMWLELVTEFQKQFRVLKDSVLTESLDHKLEILPALAHYCLAWIFDEKRDAEEALQYADEGSTLLSEVTDAPEKAVLFIRLFTMRANIYLRLHDLEKADVNYKKAILFTEEVPLETSFWEVGQLHLLSGKLHRWNERNQQAAESYREAEKIFEQLDDPLQLQKTRSNLATTLSDLGHINSSIAESQNVLKQISYQEDYELTKVAIAEKSNLLDSLTLIGHFEDANTLGEEALAESREHYLLGEELALLINLAKVEVNINALSLAKKHLESSLKLARELNVRGYIGEIMAVWADLEYHADKMETAQTHIAEAFMEGFYGPYELEAMRTHARIQSKLGHREDALKLLQKSILLAQKNEYPYHIARSALEISSLYFDLGDKEGAESNLEIAIIYFEKEKITYYHQLAIALSEKMSQ